MSTDIFFCLKYFAFLFDPFLCFEVSFKYGKSDQKLQTQIKQPKKTDDAGKFCFYTQIKIGGAYHILLEKSQRNHFETL